MNLREILSTTIIGNASGDAKLMYEIDAFISDLSASCFQRASALQHMEVHVMGLENTRFSAGSDLKYIQRYLESRG